MTTTPTLFDLDQTPPRGRLGVILGGPAGHQVRVDTAWREDLQGRRVRQLLLQCSCGWSEGWLTSQQAADQARQAHAQPYLDRRPEGRQDPPG